jgi:tetratricopeptide (TPR) repeat protein
MTKRSSNPRCNWLFGAVAIVAVCCTGCPSQPSQPTQAAAAKRAAQQRMNESNALLDSIASQLRNMAEATQLELAPPTVVIDAQKTTNGEDAMAIITRRPEAPSEPANLLRVPQQNVRFRAVGVRPGDTLKYFAVYDRDTQNRLRETREVDIVTMAAVNLTVAQVLGEDALLIEGGLVAEVLEPMKIEVWRNVDDRMRDINERLARYANRREPALAWQPTPDDAAMAPLTERLNQWLRQGAAAAGSAWRPAQLVETLDQSLREAEGVATTIASKALTDGAFTADDSQSLQAATWMRDIGSWARGDEPEPVAEATRLFDWVVRNVQLVADENERPHAAWDSLLFGRGSARQRALVFAGLCRQQRLPAAAVSVPVQGGERLLVGVTAGEGLYLFDPALGLPLPGPQGRPVATLAEATADDSLLRQLDLEGAPYPVRAADLSKAKIAVIAEPLALSRRARLLEQRLSGADAVALAIDADADAARFAKLRPASEGDAAPSPVTLWPAPFELLRMRLEADRGARAREVQAFLPLAWRPALWKGRVLQFRGRVEAPGQRPSDVLAEPVNDHRAAQQLFTDPRVRPSDRQLAKVPSIEKREIYQRTKALATAWLGTLLVDRGEFRTARRWLENDVLAGPDAAELADGVRHNLARAYAGQGDLDRAIELYESAPEAPQSQGDRVRAKRLRLQRSTKSDPTK